MSRITETMARLSRERRKALIPYITSGFPRRGDTVAVMHAMVAEGADLIELGVPFSDPMADGPTIQKANEVALAQGVSLHDVLDYVRQFRRDDAATPVVLMGYANPIERMGVAAFLKAAAQAGVDGLIVVDYPPEESADFAVAARALGIDLIFLVAPTSTDARIAHILGSASGYLYYVSLKGITGGTMNTDEVLGKVGALKARTDVPVCVGFGIRDADTAQAIGRAADGVIIGTRMIQVLEEGDAAGAAARAGAFIADIRRALDSIGAAR